MVIAMQCEPISFPRAELGEGPVWHEGALWWVDIQAGSLNRFAPDCELTLTRHCGKMLGAAVPCVEMEYWMLALQSGFARLHWRTGAIEPVGNPEIERPRNRYNDGKCDPAGRFWAGTLNFDGKPEHAGLYVLDTDGRTRVGFAPVSLSNGMGWTRDGSTMFYIDTIPHRIHAFDFDVATGTLSNSRIFLQVPDELGHPDGMCMDENDNLWVALWGGAAVICLDGKTGKILEKIETPARQTSSCCFGGENLDELYITSAWQGYSPAQRAAEPLAGCIFQAKPGVRGLPVQKFGKPRN